MIKNFGKNFQVFVKIVSKYLNGGGGGGEGGGGGVDGLV